MTMSRVPTCICTWLFCCVLCSVMCYLQHVDMSDCGGRFVLFSFVDRGHADVKMRKKFGDNVAKTLGL